MNIPLAEKIQRRHSKQCDICMLIDVDNREMKWHLWKEEYISLEQHYVCDECVQGLMEIRKKCHQSVDNPKQELFEGFIPWFAKQIPGMLDNFRKNVETINP